MQKLLSNKKSRFDFNLVFGRRRRHLPILIRFVSLHWLHFSSRFTLLITRVNIECVGNARQILGVRVSLECFLHTTLVRFLKGSLGVP